MSDDENERTEAEIKQALSNFEVTDEQRAEARDRAESRGSGSGSVVVKPQLCGKYCSGCPHGPYAWLVSDEGWTYLGAVGEGSGDAKTSTDKQEASESPGMETRTLTDSVDQEDLLAAPLANSVDDLEEGDIIATDIRGRAGKLNSKFRVVDVDTDAGEITVENEAGSETVLEYLDSGRWTDEGPRFGQVANLTNTGNGEGTVDDYFDDLARKAKTETLRRGRSTPNRDSYTTSLQVSLDGKKETVDVDRVLDGDDEATVVGDLDPLTERIVAREMEEKGWTYVDSDDVQEQSYKDSWRGGAKTGVFRRVPDNAIAEEISDDEARDIVADELGVDAGEISEIVSATAYENGDHNIRYTVDDGPAISNENYVVDSYHGHADDPVVGYEDDANLSADPGSAIALTNVKETQYGPKATVDIDYDDKDDLKDLDWDSAHPNWNGDSWSVDADADALQYVKEEMEGKGFDVRLSKEAKKQMAEGDD